MYRFFRKNSYLCHIKINNKEYGINSIEFSTATSFENVCF